MDSSRTAINTKKRETADIRWPTSIKLGGMTYLASLLGRARLQIEASPAPPSTSPTPAPANQDQKISPPTQSSPPIWFIITKNTRRVWFLQSQIT